MKKIVVISECSKSTNELKNLNSDKYTLNIETQISGDITNEISEEEIRSSDAVLFVIENTVEEIEGIERFIDIEYYEVEPSHVINNAKGVMIEILSDIN